MFLFSLYLSATRSCANYYEFISLDEYKLVTCLPEKLKARKISTRRQTISTAQNVVNELVVDSNNFSMGPSVINEPDDQHSLGSLSSVTLPSEPQNAHNTNEANKLEILNNFNPFNTIKNAPFILRNQRLASI